MKEQFDMATVPVKNINGDTVGSIELNDAIFGVSVNEHAVHMSVVQYLANRRQGTKSTLTRAEVRGGGRKPWRQKGTGRARQGSIRSPQWRGGGVVFAPKPRDFSIKLNKKQKRLALKSALTDKVLRDKLIVLESFDLPEIKTKAVVNVCENLATQDALFVMAGSNTNVMLSARNIPGIKTAGVNTINVYDILRYDNFIVTKDAVAQIEEVYA
jgi:large subunit ribosomal protein L4